MDLDAASATEPDVNAQSSPFVDKHNNSRPPSQHTPSPDKNPFRSPWISSVASSPTRAPQSPYRSTTPQDDSKPPALQTRRSISNLNASRVGTPQIRRVSSNLNPASPKVEVKAAQLSYPISSSSPNQIAHEHYQKELARHVTTSSEVVVFVHNSCYGHRYSRPRTSKSTLSTIVERPERIQAILLGVATAYVRLSNVCTVGSYVPSPQFGWDKTLALPFTIQITSRFVPLDHAAVTSVHGAKWMEELQIMCDTAETKLALNGKELVRPIGYGKDDAGNPLPKLHEGDLYLCSESLAALQGCLGGVCDATDAVFESGKARRAFVCIRPPGHHCSSEYPSGFCWLNNVHIGISYAAIHHGLTHAAIFDFDLHHGDGSQSIAWNHNQTANTLPKNGAPHKKVPIAYYSLHDINSYPCEWGDEEKVKNASLCIHNAHGQSIWNVHLEPWTSLEAFWQLYETRYKIILQKARSFLEYHAQRLRAAGTSPKAAIFISAGFDASQWEGAGMQRHQVNVPTEFYARFTRDIVELAETHDLGVDGRIISVLEGGYSDRALTSGILSHMCGLAGADHLAEGEAHITPMSVGGADSGSQVRETSWWSSENLEALEATVTGTVPSTPSTTSKRVEKQPNNYSSPTQASTARMTEYARERRSLSSQLEAKIVSDIETFEPVPEVDWATAAYELSRLLIPSNRQISSYRHDELNAEATRVRRERQSILSLSAPNEESMQLRTRKTKVLGVETARTSSRNQNRRTTIAAVSELPDPSLAQEFAPTRPRRRSSAASSMLASFQDVSIGEHTIDRSNMMSISASNRSSDMPDKKSTSKKTRLLGAKKTVSRPGSPIKSSKSIKNGQRASNSTNNPANSAQDHDRGVPIPTLSEDGTTIGRTTPDAMDDLTTSMKKVSIKLKLPSLEQHVANQKKIEEDSRPRSRVTRKPPVPRAVRTKGPANVQPTVSGKGQTSPLLFETKQALPAASFQNEGTIQAPDQYLTQHTLASKDSTMLISDGTDKIDDTGTGRDALETPASMAIHRELPELAQGQSHHEIRATLSQDGRGDLHRQPSIIPSESSVPQPNTPKKTRHDLPVFTSSTQILFSARQEPST